ncbi:hypothetical protein BY996DRAFT_6591824 [Phakopsora pachyrhizi]|nr:hypothetical protein BY996DRAFT_6591824 [Phakopsora pachyrhizi]
MGGRSSAALLKLSTLKMAQGQLIWIIFEDGEKLLKNVAQELSSSLDLAYVYFTYGPTLHLPIGHDQDWVGLDYEEQPLDQRFFETSTDPSFTLKSCH